MGKDRGTGLGLAVVFGIISKHGGVIDVRSELGVGTTFLVHLPLLEQVGAAVGVIETSSPEEIPRGSETVLIVEDEAGLRRLLTTTLETSGYRVFSASDGADAMEFLLGRAENIDAVVLDLNLPRLSGLQIREFIRRNRPGTRLVVASGHVPPELRQDIEQEGDAVIVNKPFTLATLARSVRQALAGCK